MVGAERAAVMLTREERQPLNVNKVVLWKPTHTREKRKNLEEKSEGAR